MLTETLIVELGTSTAHTSRTLMVDELGALLFAVPKHAPASAYRDAVMADNVLLKRTIATRKKTLHSLRVLYGLEPDDVPFTAMRAFWELDPSGRPLLALLLAAVRDEALRASATVIINSRLNEELQPELFGEMVRETLPGRFSDKTLRSMGQNLAATWQKSSHLKGHKVKVRSKAACTPGAAAYALLLGSLSGERGIMLYGTLWAKLLDATEPELDALAFAASQRGWLSYRRMGDVLELNFRDFLAALADKRV